ncbi:MAG: MgtC/SapB family protein [Acidimicrobiales bacterium]
MLPTSLLSFVHGDLGVSVADQAQTMGLVAMAMVLGAIIGAERELANKSAGLRTHALVAAGSALVVAVGHLLFLASADGQGDPSRALHGVVTGIGFIGAGAIIRHHHTSVEGLTTAASLWFAAGVGIATGLGLWVVAVGSTVLGLTVLSAMRWLDGFADRRAAQRAEPPSG